MHARQVGVRPSRRRRLALAAFVVVLAGGAAVGVVTTGTVAQISGAAAAVASPSIRTAAAVAPTTTRTLDSATVAKVDVSQLISSTLPSVVSITVQVPNGQAAGTGFVVSSAGQIGLTAVATKRIGGFSLGIGQQSIHKFA